MLLLLGAALASAAPAAAIDDPTRPDARVTHGPSCRPGGLVVEVVAGTVPYAVRLATTRTPAGEDEAQLAPGETVVLRTGDVAWGETIDGRLEFTAGDGSGTAFTDELEEYSFTRPTREDCDAVAQPTNPDPTPPPSAAPTAAPTETPDAGSDSGPGADPTPGTPSPTPTPSAEPRPSGSVSPSPADRSSEAPVRAVSPGGTVTVSAGGFLPGEEVSIQLHEGGEVLGTATAGRDGRVEAEIRIPDGAAAGRTTVSLVGAESAVVADVELRIAGADRVVATQDWRDLVPLTSAAVALVGTVSTLVSVLGQRGSRRRSPIRSA
ncbi:hypothetical protein [Blastococcus haudaquaticus]|uniref:Neocarzinostatin family protein n=1 Tax=Blastococcus haudaquaticus TaxID=1938745 RepID=A0A286GZ19_9ACTN|nr:hypothetical protein [Blastococcus haudaquaticus]SOE00456.1 hypothetical protein SAMN06272739_2604 [Blastococcus haudaquaticus]